MNIDSAVCWRVFGLVMLLVSVPAVARGEERMEKEQKLELTGFDTRVELSAENWNQGITSIRVHGQEEIPFLLPVLSGHHFFTGIWPPPKDAIEYEPHESPGYLVRRASTSAMYHQPVTLYSKIETRIEYSLVEKGTVDILFETISHAKKYPYDYVGLFWGTVVQDGGQRGFHTLVKDGEAGVRWSYFSASGDATVTDRHTILGPDMDAPEHDPEHPQCYFFAQSGKRFALPIQVGRWRDLAMVLELNDPCVAFTDVLMATAVGGPSWDVYWCLKPGETRRIRCRLTIGQWNGWEQIEERYRQWAFCPDTTFKVSECSHGVMQTFTVPATTEPKSESGLTLSRRLFERRGKVLLQELGLLDKCSVVCLGGTSQNAGLDDEWSRDHIWGPYLTFVLSKEDYAEHHQALGNALAIMPDEVDGVNWQGYNGPKPRKTSVWEMDAFLRLLTGTDAKPYKDSDWIPLLTRSSFLGRRWSELMFDATQGEIFHDPGRRFTTMWRHRTGFCPPNIHRALLARSLFRVWNAGPEYNLLRSKQRKDNLAYKLCLDRFVNEVMELAFCWNERYVPQFKWRVQQFRRLPIRPQEISENLGMIAESNSVEITFRCAQRVVVCIKKLMKDLYHLETSLDQPLSAFAHEVHSRIDDDEVRKITELDW